MLISVSQGTQTSLLVEIAVCLNIDCLNWQSITFGIWETSHHTTREEELFIYSEIIMTKWRCSFPSPSRPLIDIIFSLSSFAGMSNYFRFFLARLCLQKCMKKKRKNLIYDNQVDYMQISVLWLFSSSLKSFCCSRLSLWVIEQIFKWKWVDCQNGMESGGSVWGVRRAPR